MLKSIRRILSAMTLFLVISAISCASSPTLGARPLRNRLLEISPDRPALQYQYKVCTKKVLFLCTEEKMQVEYYDLTDEAVRKQLRAVGFFAKTLESP